ncbi:methionine--tRNA ligase, partial [SAR86 cluster bacterium]|nr:methionine--tRNA ligase [SAR86 cluster bacterium]
MSRQLLITSALPYANGPLHFGHLLEHVQTDIWVRVNKLLENECIYVCASDAHGTPVMLKAEDEGVEPEELIKNITKIHKKSLEGFYINHDNYHTTHSKENKKYSELIFSRANKKGLIIKKTIEQLFDESKGLFLSDRYVQGTCPTCNSENQHGDNCENCGAKYEATELKNPISTFSGQTPSIKKSEHLFFDLSLLKNEISSWIKDTNLQTAVKNKLKEWFDEGLRPWDISRDKPYFGFNIPGYEDKYFYVWLDAPIGYIASLDNFLSSSSSNISTEDIWNKDSDVDIYHFIGKDILNFHTLFWPALLDAGDFKKPKNVFVHGFMTLNGKKMSKSKGNFLLIQDYLDLLQPDYMRYFLATKLSNGIDDLDLDLLDFQKKVNTDLVGKFINIASRSQSFLKQFDNKTSSNLDESLLNLFVSKKEEIFNHYLDRNYSKALKEVMKLADQANQYVDKNEPWILNK